jgi:hypothetical protein
MKISKKIKVPQLLKIFFPNYAFGTIFKFQIFLKIEFWSLKFHNPIFKNI